MPISRRKAKLAAVVASGLALATAATTLYSPAQGLDLPLGLNLPVDLDLSSGGRPELAVTEIGRIGNLGAEIVAYDKRNSRAWVTDAIDAEVAIVDLSNPMAPTLWKTVPLGAFGTTVTSVAISGRHAVVGTRPTVTGATSRGKVVLLDLDGNVTDDALAGFGPDAVTFTPDGDHVLVANEGEPDGYQPGQADPNGSVSILEVARGEFGGNREAVFTGLTSTPTGLRYSSPAPTLAQDIEPEYIAVTDDSRTAFVTLQENNAVAEIDVPRARLDAIHPAGSAYHSVEKYALDASDRDDPGGATAITIKPRPELFGMRMPDAISTFRHLGRTYYATANEGDQREYAGLPGGADSRRVKDIPTGELPTAWGGNAAALRTDAELGRLTVTRVAPWQPGGPLYTYGSRSFSIFDDSGHLVYDSGNEFERLTSAAVPTLFNSEKGDPALVDTRSDNKGPEPEGLTTGRAYGRELAVITLERTGGIVVYDVSDPRHPSLVAYVRGDAGNAGPEGVQIVEQGASTLILVASEEGTGGGALTVYAIRRG